MATATEAREWARSSLRGIGNSLYTPFSGDDGDDIDWDAYRTLVRYCVGELRHPMLWCTSGIAEFWSLTMDERKRLLEVAIEEGRAADPDVVVQACTAATSAKDCLELTLHAQQAGADIVYIQTPMMEAHGGEGVLRFFQYVADRSDIALGMFNSPSSGYVLTPAEGARIYDEIPAVCATKEGAFRPASQQAASRPRARPDDLGMRYDGLPRRAGCAPGSSGPHSWALPATSTKLRNIRSCPNTGNWCGATSCPRRWTTRRSPVSTSSVSTSRSWFTCYPGRPDYFTHWGGAFKYAASVLGLPIGAYPHSRPPQAEVPEEAKAQIDAAYRRFGLVGG